MKLPSTEVFFEACPKPFLKPHPTIASQGCDNDGEGSFGDCCSGNCDSFALGGNAETYQWPNMPVTEWTAGA